MQYMGSKKRIAKYIIPIMLSHRSKNQYWVEPFVGGANVIDKVDGPRIGNDINEYLIELFKKVQDGWIPPTNISREMYYDIKENIDKYDKALVGFVGFACSFGGKWWGGYAINNKKYNYAQGGSNVLVRQAKSFKGIQFISGNYDKLDIPKESIIYCDPPYQNMTNYKNEFNHDKFWNWCRIKTREGHEVFVSEYEAPNDFECLIEIKNTALLNKNIIYEKMERLFKCKGECI